MVSMIPRYSTRQEHSIRHFIPIENANILSANGRIIRPLTPEEEGRWSTAPRYDQPVKWPACHGRREAVRSTYSAIHTQASS